jgi:hypothetical protein
VSLGIATPEYQGRGGDAGNPQRSVRDLHLLESSGHLQVNSTIAERDSEGRTPRGELKVAPSFVKNSFCTNANIHAPPAVG